MKPREFWLFETGMSAGDGYSEYAVTSDKPTEAIDEHIHVREIPHDEVHSTQLTAYYKPSIDWEKVWAQHNERRVDLWPNQQLLIQQLVESQLKGEE